MDFQLGLLLVADEALPPDGSLVDEFLYGCPDAHLVVYFSGLIDLQEVLPAATRVAFLQPVLNEVSHHLDLLDQRPIKLGLQALNVSLLALIANVLLAFLADVYHLLFVAFVSAST